MKIPVTFLGTGQAVPTVKRNHLGIVFRYKSEMILVDCGEGIQTQFRKAKINPCKLTKILITHFHADHILGLPGLLQTLALNSYSGTLEIYVPKKTSHFIKRIMDIFVFRESLKYVVKEVSGKFFENNDFTLEAKKLEHGTATQGYAFIEKDKIRINKKKFKKAKIKNSPLIAQLIKGKDVVIDKKKLKAKDLTYKEKGKKIAFVFDTGYCKEAIALAKNSDFLICESTYLEEDKDLAKKHKHLTSAQAAKIAKSAKADKLMLVHISQKNSLREKEILSEARKVFKKTDLAEDLMVVEV